MPAGELYINDQDAYTTWGVSFEDGALSALMTPPSMKDVIVNESRLEHGKRRMNLIPRMQERELTLPFHLVASNKTQYLQRYAAFVNEITGNEYVDIRTSYQVGVTYRCIYVSCSQFSQFIDGLAKFTLKVIEPNPYER